MKTRIVYKLTDINTRSYNSQASAAHFSVLQYAVGVTTVPQLAGTPLFAFDSVRAAKKWAASCLPGSAKLFMARATQVRALTAKQIRDRAINLYPYIINPGVQSKWAGWTRIRSQKPHEGMLLCSSIKLIKEIKCSTTRSK